MVHFSRYTEGTTATVQQQIAAVEASIPQSSASITELVATTNRLAALHGALEVFTAADALIAKQLPEETVIDIVTELIINGANDTWSGRGNDAARARYDGKLDAFRIVRSTLRFRIDRRDRDGVSPADLAYRVLAGASRVGTDLRSALDLSDEDFRALIALSEQSELNGTSV